MIKVSSSSYKYLKTDFSGVNVYVIPMKVKDVIYINYVAVRGRDDEEGAVQRVLSRRRISSIKDFILSGNMFFNTFILNWTEKIIKPSINKEDITIPIVPSAAQVIDGQHRLAGLEEAIKLKQKIGEETILVALCIGLETREAATIFLNINAEQRPVPKSLIYDLFGEAVDNEDHAINRARDIAQELNDNPESPFYRTIKFPGSPRGAGTIDLSTVVSSIKTHLGPEGIFRAINISSLDSQRLIITNYFKAIYNFYENENVWASKSKNPFLRSSGFSGAIDYLPSILRLCANKKSFSIQTFHSLLRLDDEPLLLNEDIEKLDGKTARKRIRDYLERYQLKNLPDQEEYEF